MNKTEHTIVLNKGQGKTEVHVFLNVSAKRKDKFELAVEQESKGFAVAGYGGPDGIERFKFKDGTQIARWTCWANSD